MQDLVPLWFKPCIFISMIPRKKAQNQVNLFSSFEDTLNQKHPLYILANKIRWQIFEDAFLPLYCQDNGRPAKLLDTVYWNGYN